jgi:hypothetical protein
VKLSEKTIQSAIMRRYNREKYRLFRNNVGFDKRTKTRYGLCNGSSDLIGWHTITVTPDMVGTEIAVFMAVEVKAPGKKPTKSQRNFLDQVVKSGGIGIVIDHV